MSFALLTCVLLVASLQPCIAVVYSYTPSQAAALGTFAYSGTQLKDGDIIELAPGTYNVPINAAASTNGGVNIGIWFKNRCAAGARVTLRGQAGTDYPILTFAANTNIGLLLNDPQGVQWTVQHLHLKGINDGAATAANTAYCFFHKAWDSVLDDVKIETCAMGMNSHDTESGSLTMQYCEVFGCGNGVYSHQLYASTSQTDPTVVFTLRHSYLHDGKGGNAIKSRFPSNRIEYNWVDHTAPSGLSIYRPLEMIGGQDVLSPPLGNSQSNVVGNVFVKTDAAGNYGLSRIGYDGTGNSRGRYRFVANTWIGSTTQTTGITLWGEVMSASFYDNIFYLPGSGQSVVNLPAEYTGATPTWSASNNWVYTGTSVAQFTAAGITFGTVSGTDPGFSSLAGWDLRLLATSVCRGAGVNPPPNPNLTNTLVIPSTAVTNSPTRGKTTSATAVARPTGAVDIGAFAAIAPVTTPPTTAPVTTKPPTTAPVTSAPPTTAPVTTKPPTTAPVTASPTTVPVTTKPPTTAPVTSAPPTTAPATTKPPTTAPSSTTPPPGTTVPVTTTPITTPPVGTTPTPTAPTTTQPSPPTTAPPATTVPTTTRPATTSPSTTTPVTTQPGATSPAPSSTVAPTQPATTAPPPTSAGPTPSPLPSATAAPTASPLPSSTVAPTGTQASGTTFAPGSSCLLHIYTKGCASSSVLVSALATATNINPSDISVQSYGTCPDSPTDPHLILSIAGGNCVATQTALDAINAVNQTTGGVVSTAFAATEPKPSKGKKFPMWLIGVIIVGVLIVAALVALSVWLLLKGRHARRPTVRSEWGTDMAGLYAMPGTL